VNDTGLGGGRSFEARTHGCFTGAEDGEAAGTDERDFRRDVRRIDPRLGVDACVVDDGVSGDVPAVGPTVSDQGAGERDVVADLERCLYPGIRKNAVNRRRHPEQLIELTGRRMRAERVGEPRRDRTVALRAQRVGLDAVDPGRSNPWEAHRVSGRGCNGRVVLVDHEPTVR